MILTSVLGEALWITVAEAVKCKKVARKSAVKDDGFRTPQVELLLGNTGWVTHIDNNIKLVTIHSEMTIYAACRVFEQILQQNIPQI